MLDILLKGLVFGVVLALLIGPVFFTLIQTSIERGFVKGIFVAIGVSLSDIFYITIVYMGLSKLLESNGTQVYLAYVGGIILVCFGVYYVFIKSRRNFKELVNIPANRNVLRYIIKGFVINGLSPFVLIFWIGAVGLASSEFGYTGNDIILFFIAVVATVFITDLIKVWLAGLFRNLMTPQVMRAMNVAIGLVLIFFGGRLLLWPL